MARSRSPVLALILLFALGSLAAESPEPAKEASEEVIQLEPVVVTATRTEQQLKDVAANVTVYTKEDIEKSAAQTVDDFLRQLPGFSLFRRSSSLVAHPTTQGVSLRGIGPSGVSRTLVLLDGVPLNDPFGGWVYWSKVPLKSIERIEVVRGGGSSVWGNYALGGVIHIITKRPEKRTLTFLGEGGNRGTVNLDLFASDLWGPIGVAVGGNFFHTNGYEVIREDQRGTIDINADSEHMTFNGKLEYTLSENATLSLQGSYFTEDRGNGTPLTNNSTDAGYIRGGANFKTPDGSEWKLDVFSHLQTFQSTFSRQFPDRNSELPALDQFDVPATAVGTSLQWSKQIYESHLMTAGTDLRWIDGETNEDFRFVGGQFTQRRKAGGEQYLAGIFLQDIWSPTPTWQVTVGGRLDFWRSFDGSRVEQNIQTGEINPVTTGPFPDRDRLAFSPRVAVLFHATDDLSARSSFYMGFRAPTLNELYRPFQVRTDVTEANATLDPERLIGGEVGVDYVFFDGFLGRLTGFWNELKDPIANVTIGIAPPPPGAPVPVPPCLRVPRGGACRQRQNLERSRIRGIEVELEYRPNASWVMSGSYLFNDTEVLSAPNQPQLEGNQIAQVPEHRFTLILSYSNPDILNATIEGRYVGEQFEDDLNSITLDDFFVVNLRLSRQIMKGWEAFLSVENLFDKTYEVGETTDGIVTIGAPLLVHGGIQAQF
ncbi:MAG: TonB-dependent receptor [candidate division NC10 bacterium]|jgi:outer membrane receptor protein involved in Fe transport